MGKALAEEYPEIRHRFFDRAEAILPGLVSLMFEGPEDDLVKTENQQPAIFLVSASIDAALRERGMAPDAVAGHSLGEYAALVAAGTLDFEDGLRLTRRRGELMAEIGARTGGIMAAVVGLPAEEVEAACREASVLGVVEVANYNSPVQTVISGEEPAVRRVMGWVKERGGGRAIQLNVSAPFHSPLMAPLAAAFLPELERVTIRDPLVPVVANVTAEYERDEATVRRNLILQLDGPVRWVASMRRLVDDGFTTFVEVGPGKVLSGLMRQIAPEVTAASTGDPTGIARAAAR
jgi:[acyl-carrier-protein] S-malonyltransferase